MVKDTLYKQLMEELSKLSAFGDLQYFAKRYIYSALTDDEIVSILVKKKEGLQLPVFNKDLLKNEAIQIQTAKVLGLLQCSENESEFKNLAEKLIQSQRGYETTINFDQILNRLLKLPIK